LVVFFSIITLFAIGWAGLLLKLAHSPIGLSLLKPHIQKAIDDNESHLQISFDDVNLVWKRWTKPYEIVITNIKIAPKTPNAEAIIIPEVGVSLNLSKLVDQQIALKTLSIYDPHLTIDRSDGSGFIIKVEDDAEQPPLNVNDILGHLTLDEKGQLPPILASLSSLHIVDANLTLIDENKDGRWVLPKASFILERHEEGFRLRTLLTPHDSLSTGGHVELDFKYRLNASRMHVYASLHKIRLADLITFTGDESSRESSFDTVYRNLKAINFPLSGTFDVQMNPHNGDIVGGQVQLKGKSGQLFLSDSPLEISKTSLKATLKPRSVTVEEMIFAIDKTQLLITGNVETESGRLSLFSALPPLTTFEGDVTVARMPIENLKRFWPEGAAPAAREWLLEHMILGMISQTGVTLKAHMDEAQKFTLDTLKGNMDFNDLTMSYFGELPLLTHLSGRAEFDQNHFDIIPSQASLLGLKLKDASIKITGLDNDQETLYLDMNLEGPLADVLRVIDENPLGYTTKANLTPDRTEGVGGGRLKMEIPLLSDVKFDDVKMEMKAHFDHVATAMDLGSMPAKFKEGSFDLDLTHERMKIDGKGVLNDLPSTLDCLYLFADKHKEPWDMQLNIHTTATADDFKKWGHDYTDFITGPMKTRFYYEVGGKTPSLFGMELGLDKALIKVDPIGWHKPKGEPGHLNFQLSLHEGKFQKIQHIDLQSAYLHAQGQGQFGDDGKIHSLDLTSIKMDETDAAVSILWPQIGGCEIHFSGAKVNAEKFMEYVEEDNKKLRESTLPLKISSKVDQLRMSEGKVFKNVTSNVELILHPDDVEWKHIHLTAEAGKGTAKKGEMMNVSGGLSFDLKETSPTEQSLEIRANDAGTVLKNLGIYDYVNSGYMVVKATRPKKKPFKGTFKLQNFDATQITLATRLAAVLSPVGIINLFSEDERLSIGEFKSDFTYSEDEVTFQNGVGSSLSVGFTADGKFDRVARIMDVKGSVVPAYVINSILGNIPIIGDLLNGGKGQGLFAVDYKIQGPFEEPEVDANPLSALAPGFIRNIFGN